MLIRTNPDWNHPAYRWWTLKCWRETGDFGVKIGPLTVAAYWWDGYAATVSWMNRWFIDTGLDRMETPRG